MAIESRVETDDYTVFRRSIYKLGNLDPLTDTVSLTREEATALADRLAARLGAEHDHSENITQAVVAEMGQDEYDRLTSIIFPLRVGTKVQVGVLGDLFTCRPCVFMSGEGGYDKLRSKELRKLVDAYQRATKDYLVYHGSDERWSSTLSDEALLLKERSGYTEDKIANIFGVSKRTIQGWLKKALERRDQKFA
jgi:hypothetical protein